MRNAGLICKIKDTWDHDAEVVCRWCVLVSRARVGRRDGRGLLITSDADIPAILGHLGSVWFKVSENNNVGRGKQLAFGLVLGGEDVAVLEVLEQLVGETVHLVTGVVEDNVSFVVVEVGDVVVLASSDEEGLAPDEEPLSEKALARVPRLVPIPCHLAFGLTTCQTITKRASRGAMIARPSRSRRNVCLRYRSTNSLGNRHRGSGTRGGSVLVEVEDGLVLPLPEDDVGHGRLESGSVVAEADCRSQAPRVRSESGSGGSGLRVRKQVDVGRAS